jgi:hypothetical protein
MLVESSSYNMKPPRNLPDPPCKSFSPEVDAVLVEDLRTSPSRGPDEMRNSARPLAVKSPFAEGIELCCMRGLLKNVGFSRSEASSEGLRELTLLLLLLLLLLVVAFSDPGAGISKL